MYIKLMMKYRLLSAEATYYLETLELNLGLVWG